MSVPGSPRILLIADSDSRFKWAALVAEALGGAPRTVTACLLRSRAMPTPRQLEETGFSIPWFSATLGELAASGSFMHYDVVVVSTTGSAHFRIVAAINKLVAERQAKDRPVIVTGYVGVVYEKHLEGILWRIGADVICLNSLHDYELFKGYCDDLGLDSSALVRSGFVMAMPERQEPHEREIEHVVFVVQPSVPEKKEERLYILRQLMAYAERYPNRKVTVKLRAQPGEPSTHRERFHYLELYEEIPEAERQPLNFVYGRMDHLLDTTDLCITVSSTAALEALSRGIPTAILVDCGIRELYGNHFFAGSGCLTSFARLLKDEIPIVKPEWLDRYGFSSEDRVENVRDRVHALLAEQAKNPGPLPPQDMFYTREMAPFLYERLEQTAVLEKPPPTVVQRLVQKPLRKLLRRLFEGPVFRIYNRMARWAGL